MSKRRKHASEESGSAGNRHRQSRESGLHQALAELREQWKNQGDEILQLKARMRTLESTRNTRYLERGESKEVAAEVETRDVERRQSKEVTERLSSRVAEVKFIILMCLRGCWLISSLRRPTLGVCPFGQIRVRPLASDTSGRRTRNGSTSWCDNTPMVLLQTIAPSVAWTRPERSPLS